MRSANYVYHGIIDILDGWMDIEDYMNTVKKRGMGGGSLESRLYNAANEFVSAVKLAQPYMLAEVGSDYQNLIHGPLVMCGPYNDMYESGIISVFWRGSNNGWSVVVSEKELVWLNEFRSPLKEMRDEHRCF